MSSATEYAPICSVRQKKGWIGPTPNVPKAGQRSTGCSWDNVDINFHKVPQYVENEIAARIAARDSHTIVVDPNLQQMLRGHNDDVYRRIHQVCPDLWLCGETQVGAGSQIGDRHVFRRRVDEWRVITGSPKLPKPTEDEWKEMSQTQKWQYRKKSYDSRPYITISVMTEYGSTRVDHHSDGWDRYIVVYEQGTPSPYPFTIDDTQ